MLLLWHTQNTPNSLDFKSFAMWFAELHQNIARGQSQPVSIACLKIKNSISLSGSDTQSKVSDFCSESQIASLPLPVPSFRSVIPLSAKNFLTAFILSSPASAVGIYTKTSGLIFAFSFSKRFLVPIVFCTLFANNFLRISLVVGYLVNFFVNNQLPSWSFLRQSHLSAQQKHSQPFRAPNPLDQA